MRSNSVKVQTCILFRISKASHSILHDVKKSLFDARSCCTWASSIFSYKRLESSCLRLGEEIGGNDQVISNIVQGRLVRMVPM